MRYRLSGRREERTAGREFRRAIRPSNFQSESSVIVWTGLIDNLAISSYVLPPRLNVANYLQFLMEELPSLSEDALLNVRRHMWIQIDGAAAHFRIKEMDLYQQ